MSESLRRTFCDVDAFEEQARQLGWQGEVRQTARGRFAVDLALTSGPGFVAMRTRHSVANVRRISTPSNARTFGLVVPDGDRNTWCSRAFDRAVVQMMPRIDYVSANAAGHTGFQIAYEDDFVSEMFEQLELPGRLDDGARLVEVEREQGFSMARQLERLAGGIPDSDPRQRAQDVLAFLLKRFVQSDRLYGSRSDGRRRALRNAQAYLEEHLAEPLTLMDLCRVAGVSRRCLTQAFQEGLGIGPMAYLKFLRLHRVRAALTGPAAPETAIADIANASGFWHMGQFAHDYRKVFGERPSETLKRRFGPMSGSSPPLDG